MSSLRLSLRHLEYFVAAAESGTMTAAAERFYVSQSAVSLGIADLERALGVQLLLRHKARGLTVTDAGQRMLADTRALLARAEELQSSARSLGQELAGTLVVGCFVTLAPFLMPRVLGEFEAEHPGIQLDFVEGSLSDLQERLLEGTCEVALMYDLDILPGIEHTVLFDTYPHVLLAADHPLARRGAVRLADLAGEPMIMLDVPPSAHYFGNLLAQAGVTPRIRHQTTSFEMVRSLVARGLGYSLLIQHPAIDLSYEGRPVVTRPIADPLAAMPVVLVRPAGLRPTRRAEAFAAYCYRAFADVTS